MAEFGSPAELVGNFSRIEIDAIDFDKAAIALNELAVYITRTQIPLRGAQRIAMEDMRKRFDTEIGPDGRPWTSLDPDYAARKAYDMGFEHPILTRDRTLRDAASSAKAWSVSGDSLFFSTSNLPDYWRVHQQGSPDFGAVFHSGKAEETGHLDSSAGTKNQNIPPRPFIGLSDEAERRILELFDIWFSAGIDQATKNFAISSHGILQARTPRGFGERIEF